MKNTMSRKDFIKKSALATAAASLSGSLMSFSELKRSRSDRKILNLINDPKNICDLAAGFSYKIISKEEELMSDGNKVPFRHDGMACFEGKNGNMILVRNHEMGMFLSIPRVKSPDPIFAYDPSAPGGTTTIHLNKNLDVITHYLSLTGTSTNCSGGKTPWGTWISCEETEFAWLEQLWMSKTHGYNFEVNPQNPLVKASPLKAMGRFKHEAIAVDENTGIVYQTEDQMDSCFYRFIPNEAEKLAKGGKLQALKILDKSKHHTSKDETVLGKEYLADWVDIENPDPSEATVREEAQRKGAAIFVRGEGAAFYGDSIYFSCTMGGKEKAGQIFKYTANKNNNNGIITLVYEAKEDGVLERPDNITLNSWGDLIICEDNGHDTQCLVGLRQDGKIYHIAANSLAEWAGACFSPDGNVLFANIQDPGMTIAIQGPWEELRKV